MKQGKVPALVTDPAFSELERNLSAARRKLDALRATGPAGLTSQHGRQDRPPAGQPDGVTARGRAAAADGRVRAVAVSNDAFGSIESVELEPRMLRMDTGELADHVRTALNAALDDMRANAWAAPAADANPGIDVGALTTRLTQVQDQATRQLYQLTSALADVLAKIGQDATVSGAVAVPDVEELFQETLRTLESVPVGGGGAGSAHPGGAPDGGDTAPADQAESRGEGEAGTGGLVRAVAGPGGRVEALAIDPAAVRKGSHEVARYAATAANAALADYAAKQRDLFAAAAADRAALAQRVQTVQDLSLRQMRAFGESLAGLIAGIAPRS
jgi:DNA-binding protein YbaB